MDDWELEQDDNDIILEDIGDRRQQQDNDKTEANSRLTNDNTQKQRKSNFHVVRDPLQNNWEQFSNDDLPIDDDVEMGETTRTGGDSFRAMESTERSGEGYYYDEDVTRRSPDRDSLEFRTYSIANTEEELLNRPKESFVKIVFKYILIISIAFVVGALTGYFFTMKRLESNSQSNCTVSATSPILHLK